MDAKKNEPNKHARKENRWSKSALFSVSFPEAAILLVIDRVARSGWQSNADSGNEIALF